MIVKIIIAIVFVISAFIGVLYLFWESDKCPKKVAVTIHDLMKWHRPIGSTYSFDGCSFTAVCSVCGKKIIEDSQGNWVEINDIQEENTNGI